MDSSYRPQSPDLSSYAPQSPDLSGYRPQSPNLAGYAPESPDLSGIPSPRFQQHFNAHQQQQRQHLQGAYPSNGFGGGLSYSPTSIPPQQQYTSQYSPPQHQGMALAQRIKSPPEDEDDYMPDAPAKKTPRRKAPPNGSDPQVPLERMDTGGVVLKTSFPVARIKRIMQADEDIGKVAQVTPHAVSRALELFMIQLISASARQAAASGGQGGKGPKRVLAQHMKKAILEDEHFDFLHEIVAKVPDAPTGKAKQEDDEDGEAKGKGKAKATRSKKRKDSGDDF